MDATFRSAQRCLLEWSPDVPPMAEGAPLEAAATAMEPPRLVAAPVIEGHGLRAHRVEGDAEPGFAAFLDGTQRSQVVGFTDGLPVVLGTVAAVIRRRVNRRLYTWGGGPEVRRRVYLPLAYLPADLAATFAARDYSVVDTTAPDADGALPDRHPFSLLDRAVHLVQMDREHAEQRLAERWCSQQGDPLYIDGGVNKSETVARHRCAVGVVKSHRTLYVEGEALTRVCRLRRGERSTVFRIPSARRTPVASWYLRLRDATGHDPMWGLVRIEAADHDTGRETAEQLTERADRISRWVLAEATPLALPDGRWDKMVYGIRDCEEFLRAVC